MLTIYLNDLGLNNALGSNKQAFITALIDNGISTLSKQALLSGNITSIPVSQIPIEQIAIGHNKFNTRNNRLLAAAYEQIRHTVDTFKTKYSAERIGVILGTSTSGIDEGIKAYKHHKKNGLLPPEFEYAQQEIGASSAFLADYADIKGINYTISTACSSSAKAIIAAARLIQADQCDMVIAGGSDALNDLTLNGFDCLEAIASNRCNPFSLNRKGINIGEGAALFVMSKTPAKIKLSGFGESSDGTHITAPDPQGRGAIQAIMAALNHAQCSANDIGYINLHGTGTHKNDAVESYIMSTVFPNKPYCSSLKSSIGHTLGSAGAHSIGACWLLLSTVYNPNRRLPKHHWDGVKDPALSQLRFTEHDTTWDKAKFMCNNFAFGGSNVSLIIESSDDYQ